MDNRAIERLKQINTAAESSLEIGVSLTAVMIVIFLVLIQDEVNLVLFIVLALGVFTMLVLSYDESGLIKRSSGLLLPWYLWILKGFCYLITRGSLPDILLIEYITSLIFQIAPAAIYEYSAPSFVRSGLGLRIFFFGMAILDLIPFSDSNPFLSLEKGIARSVILSILFILYSIRSRYDASSSPPEDTVLITFIKIQYALFAGFWLALAVGIFHSLYLGISVMIRIPKRVPPKRPLVIPQERDLSDEDEPEDKAPSKQRTSQLDSFASESLTR